MSIQRVPAVPFAQIANTTLRDTRLSFKARGLLALVLSNVGEWEASREWLIDQSEKDGLTAVQSALNELTDLGYRRVVKEQQPNGQFTTTVLWFQVPEESPSDRPMGNPTVGLSDGREPGRSIEDHPLEDHAEHQGLKKQTPDDYPILFDQFWLAYPRKKDKGHARRAWKKAVKTTDPALLIHAAVNFRQWCEQDGTDAQFIPHASTWLNGERWNDERDPEAVSDNQRRQNGHIDLIRQLAYNEGVPNPLELEG